MNVKVITRHGPSNYGSILQAIATAEAVNSLGADCEIIDYQRPDERGIKLLLGEVASKSQWNHNPLKKVLYLILRWPGNFLAQKKFDRFRREYLPLTKRYSDVRSLEEIKADVYMTGSDQVWGPIASSHFDPAYFLDFTNGKKVAYAGSFGRTEFLPSITAEYKRLLSDYTHITVRENTAVETVTNMGLSAPRQVLDPTLLMEPEYWINMTGEKDRVPNGKYILIYQIHNNPELDRYAKRLSEHTGLPLYRISPYLHHASRCGKFLYLPSLGRFIALIKNAEILVTDSFHGTAFAINLNTNFVEILPNNKTGSRNQSILALTGLQDRIITNPDDFETPMRKIDFSPVNEIISREREKSMAQLANIITD